MHFCFTNYISLRSMAGEADKIVDQVCVLSNSSSSDYDSDNEMSSRSSVVPYLSCSTNETTQSEAL